MNYIRKRQLRSRYLKLRNELQRIMEPYDCGIHVASLINPRIGILNKEIQEIVDEVEREIDPKSISEVSNS